MIHGKKILLGVTGSIAAYKAILLVRLLVKAGAEVRVVVTPAAADFVSVLTLSTLSKNKVLSVLADEDTWANHVMLGRWADVMIVAPLSCNTLAKMAGGFCDNLLMAIYLSATCPVAVAPAMDEDMWHHPSTRRNLSSIEGFGNNVIPVNSGELASGLYGEGRMSEPEEIVAFLEETYFRNLQLKGKSVLISAGPTYEAIDPVRFIGNHSSGKMGFALAEQFYFAGANVQMVCGPTTERTNYRGIKVSNVTSAEEMFESCTSFFPDADITVMAAAVADYRPLTMAMQKIKKSSDSFSIDLTKTTDILKHLGQIKSGKQLLAGFALETENERIHATEKLKNKNADLIVLNSLRDAEAGFGKDTNKVIIFDREGNEWLFPAKSKSEVAKDIVEIIIQKLHDKK